MNGLECSTNFHFVPLWAILEQMVSTFEVHKALMANSYIVHKFSLTQILFW